MNKAIARSFARAASADLLENPSALFALSNATEKGKQTAQNFILSDILRGLQREKGPVVFPHLRAAFMQAIRRKTENSGMGQATTTTSLSSIVGSLVTGLAAVGTAYYINKQNLKLEKEKLKQQQALETARREAEAAQLLAISQAKSNQVEEQYKSPGLPDWLLPVGGAVAAGAAILTVVS